MSPASAVCITPNTGRLFFFWIGAYAQDLAVEIFDLHLQRPLEIVRWVSNYSAGLHVLVMQRANVLHADPNPHTRLALVVICKKYGAFFSRDAGKSMARSPSQFESKSVQIVVDAGVHILDEKDRRRRTEGAGCGFGHKSSSGSLGSDVPSGGYIKSGVSAPSRSTLDYDDCLIHRKLRYTSPQRSIIPRK